ncbi:MAG: hypothetical protein QGH15_06705 [Kiritimatiellia bacterium]|jgi:hypothetical protein|nr:hypothetical protein [Kiritimatiellia bacterium]
MSPGDTSPLASRAESVFPLTVLAFFTSFGDFLDLAAFAGLVPCGVPRPGLAFRAVFFGEAFDETGFFGLAAAFVFTLTATAFLFVLFALIAGIVFFTADSFVDVFFLTAFFLGFAAERDFAPVEDTLAFDLVTDFLWIFAPAFDFDVDLAISCEFRPMCVSLIATPPHNTGVLLTTLVEINQALF